MKNKRYLVPTMLSAGLIPAASATDAGTGHIEESKSFVDDIVQHAKSIFELNEYDLSGHTSHMSHGSHGSHGSHSSHRSYLMPEPPDDGITYSPAEAGVEYTQLEGRNENSTPRSAVLPKSPMTASKPRILKGNSKKFGEIVSKAQIALLAKGYEVGTPNGELHSRTVAALYQYQRDVGLVPSGKLENETLNHLGIVSN